MINGLWFTVLGTRCSVLGGIASERFAYLNLLSVSAILILVLVGCMKDRVEVPKTYLFLGHPYDWNNSYKIDPRLEHIDFTQYDGIWLGGDVCSRTTESPQAMNYLDSLLDFSKGHVHWSLGNHDVMYGNLDRITTKTNRPSFYSASLDGGITLLVLNTNLFWMYASRPTQENCTEKQAQLDLIQSVLDTIQLSSHLVILHHHALLKEQKPDSLRDAFNTNPGRVTITCDSIDQFDQLIYPQLVEVQKRGVQVMLIGGDVGMRAKQFSYQTPEGIWLLGSGINNSLKQENAPDYVTNFNRDQILIFKHFPKQRKFEWEFTYLE